MILISRFYPMTFKNLFNSYLAIYNKHFILSSKYWNWEHSIYNASPKRREQNNIYYYSYRAFGGQNKIVYSTAILILFPNLNKTLYE